MTTIFHELPYSDALSFVEVNHQAVPVLPHQIVVWVSLIPGNVRELASTTPRFPAILDTGNTFGFALSEKHLEQWAVLSRESVEEMGKVKINRLTIPRLSATVWLHPNRKGVRDAFGRQPPFPLYLREGIAVYPAEATERAPRLPLLGLRALDENALQCCVHGDRLRVTVRTPPKPRTKTTAPEPGSESGPP